MFDLNTALKHLAISALVFALTSCSPSDVDSSTQEKRLFGKQIVETQGKAPVLDSNLARSAQTPLIKLSIDLWPGYYPSIIALQKGWFAESGLNVQIEMPKDTDKMLAGFAAGRIDMIGAALGDVVSIAQAIPDLKIIMAADESSGGDALLVIPLAGDPQYSGKRIGTSLGGFGEVLVREWLKRENLNPSEVELVNVDASQVPMLLQQGVIDVGQTWQPYVDQAKAVGGEVIFSSAETPGLIPDVIAVRESHFGHSSEVLSKFVTVWFRASKWWKENFEAGNQMVANFTGLNAQQISIEGIHLFSLKENVARYQSNHGTSLAQAITVYSDFYLRNGILSEPVTPSSVLTNRYLE